MGEIHAVTTNSYKKRIEELEAERDKLREEIKYLMLPDREQILQKLREAAQAWVEANDNLIEAHINLKAALEKK